MRYCRWIVKLGRGIGNFLARPKSFSLAEFAWAAIAAQSNLLQALDQT
jgi:hypothetical protein